MPYTLAHPAAVVPLYRYLGARCPLSVLVIGSMVPDFPYFLGGVSGAFSHSLLGVLLYGIPAGVMAYLLFHLLLKQPSAALLPETVSRRLSEPLLGRPAISAGSLVTISTGVGLGALTHLLWDGFTHADTFIVRHVEILQSPVGAIGAHEVRLFEALQYACSLAGLAMLAGWLRRWMRSAPLEASGRSLGWRKRCAVLAFILGAAIAACAVAGLHAVEATEAFLVAAIVTAMKGAGAAWLFYCFLWHARSSPLAQAVQGSGGE